MVRLGFLETQHWFPQGSVFAIPCANTVHRARMIYSCIGLKCGNLAFSITLFTLIIKYDLSSQMLGYSCLQTLLTLKTCRRLNNLLFSGLFLKSVCRGASSRIQHTPTLMLLYFKPQIQLDQNLTKKAA